MMTARTGRSALSSLLTLGLLLLAGDIGAAAGGGISEKPSLTDLAPDVGATGETPSLREQAAAAEPEGFELQEISVSTGRAAEGADELVSAQYLGAGTRNEIRYMTFSSDQAAEAYLKSLDPDSCSIRSLATCASRMGNRVVAGLSASTCPHPTEGIPDRASILRDFGLAQLETLK